MSESPAPIGVLVVDDHPLLRDGLAALLGAQPDLRLLGEAADGEEAIACYQQLRPDVVLMDLDATPGWRPRPSCGSARWTRAPHHRADHLPW